MSLLLLVLVPLGGAALLGGVVGSSRKTVAWFAGGVVLLALGLLASDISIPLSGHTLIQRIEWLPAHGLALDFRLDGLSMLFSLMILGIGLLVVLYAYYYLDANDSLLKLYAYLLLFMGSMLGVVLAENLLLLLIFWELTSLSSFLLISYWREDEDARNGARMALAITGAGGLALLGGFILLADMVGSYDLSVILAAGETVRGHPNYLPALILILLGAFTKSAQFPFHFWLPHAMAAPTPVSAYLHSATMVKAGVFLLARLFPVLSGTDEWTFLVGGFGLLTLLIGAVMALFQHDLKGLLAYSTISHLGLITLLFGIGTPLAAVAGVFHIINHATFKASLFMAAGIIDHEAGTRDMRRLNGLWRAMPHTATLAMVASAAMAGVPLFNGFLSKEMLFTETVDAASQMHFGWLLPVVVTIAGGFAVAYSLRFIHDAFFNGEPVALPKQPHEPPQWMKVPVEVLVLICVLVGVFPAYTVEPILAVAVESVLQGPLPEHSLAIWHGFSPAVLMSVCALAGGVLLYSQRKPLFQFSDYLAGKLDAGRLYEQVLLGLFTQAHRIVAWLDIGSLQRQVLWFVVSVLILGGVGMLLGGSALRGERDLLPADAGSVLAVMAILSAVLATVWLHHQRLLALIMVGAVGLLVSLIFVRFSAPDLALTQLSVEVVTMLLLLLALYFLPQRSPRARSASRQIRNGVIAVLGGGGMAALAWAVLTRPYAGLADYFLANSVPAGGGANVVNVILVDFRGYDTFGEITVLGLAALGVYAMLDGLKLDGHAGMHGKDPDVHPFIAATFSRLLLPLALLVSVYIFLRGHNAPGGGFVAGLVTAVALIMQYLANGVAWAQTRLTSRTHVVIALGLLIALLTGIASLIFGYPFLTSSFGHLYWPLVGEFELASAMAFDLGVYLVVVGATLLILINMGLMRDPRRSLVETKGKN